MKLVLKQSDDLVILNRSGRDTQGGLVGAFTIAGPDLEPNKPMFSTLESAKDRALAIAVERQVSVWYEDKADGEGDLVASFRVRSDR